VFWTLQNTPGNTFTTDMDGFAERCEIKNFYAGFSAQSGAVNACPSFHMRFSYCDLLGGANPIEIYSDPAWMGKRLSVDHCVLGDTDPTVGSHAIYTHHTVRTKITNNVFRNIRSGGKYGIQKFGTSNTGCDDDIITGNTFESTIMGGGIITNGQSTTLIQGNTFRCAYAIGARGPIICIGNLFAPIMASAWAGSTAVKTGNLRSNAGHLYECIRGGTTASSGGPTTTALDITDGTAHWRYVNDSTSNTGQGIVTTTSTQADCQWVIDGNVWDMHGIAGSTYNACIVIDQPRVKCTMVGNRVFAQNHVTASGSALEALNIGSLHQDAGGLERVRSVGRRPADAHAHERRHDQLPCFALRLVRRGVHEPRDAGRPLGRRPRARAHRREDVERSDRDRELGPEHAGRRDRVDRRRHPARLHQGAQQQVPRRHVDVPRAPAPAGPL
jgi:hypothetical protein